MGSDQSRGRSALSGRRRSGRRDGRGRAARQYQVDITGRVGEAHLDLVADAFVGVAAGTVGVVVGAFPASPGTTALDLPQPSTINPTQDPEHDSRSRKGRHRGTTRTPDQSQTVAAVRNYRRNNFGRDRTFNQAQVAGSICNHRNGRRDRDSSARTECNTVFNGRLDVVALSQRHQYASR